MSKVKVSIVDYGAGNMFSIARALEYLKIEVTFVNTPDGILNAEKLILPGVGAFYDAMKVLEKRQLIFALNEFVSQDKPLLGICLGMQLLFDFSEEHTYCNGLGYIPGSVKKISEYTENGGKHKIPHIGWKNITQTNNQENEGLFKSIPDNNEFYFLHSYHVTPYHDKNILGFCNYNGIKICAAVKHNNTYGVQFHPEKSRDVGLLLLTNFIKLSA